MSTIVKGSIAGVIEWASVHRPKNKYNSTEKEFTVTLNLDGHADTEKALRTVLSTHNVGQKIRIMDKEGNPVPHKFSFTRAAKTAQGDDVRIDVVDAKGTPIPSSVMIGNGSEALIHYMIAPFIDSKTGKPGSVIRLTGLQVTKLVEFEGTKSTGSKFTPVAGFTVADVHTTETFGDLDASSL